MRRWGTVIALSAAILAAGCASKPDYGYARRTRGERTYTGGAANVPDGPPESSSSLNPLSVLAVAGLWWVALFHGADSTSPPPQPVTVAPR